VLAIDATPQIGPSHPVWADGRREREGGALTRKARQATAPWSVGAAMHGRPWPRLVQTNHGPLYGLRLQNFAGDTFTARNGSVDSTIAAGGGGGFARKI
jgi:hypothetical protein